MPYAAPLDDMRFAIDTVAVPEGIEPELAEAILTEAAKFAAGELDPLNHPADRIGSVLENGVVRTPPGFREDLAHRYTTPSSRRRRTSSASTPHNSPSSVSVCSLSSGGRVTLAGESESFTGQPTVW